MVTFVRSASDPEMVIGLRKEGLDVDIVRERKRFDFAVIHQLRAIIERHQPHVLWTHGAKPHFLVRFAKLHRNRAWVAFHHGYTATSFVWRLYDQLDRWSLRGAHHVMTACEAFANDLSRRLGIRKDRISVHRSPLAVPSSRDGCAEPRDVRQELSLAPEARIVLSVGRLSKEKGHDDLIRAMHGVVERCQFDVVVLLVGDGPERARLERLSARLGLTEHIRFVGYRQDVRPYYAAADLFALTSHSEGSPNVLLEAMDAKVPIVATAVGGVGEMITDGEQGLLVRSGDPESIGRGIVALLLDPELCGALTAAAAESLGQYSLDRYYNGVRSVFEAAAARSR